jgi:hypothetical protein
LAPHEVDDDSTEQRRVSDTDDADSSNGEDVLADAPTTKLSAVDLEDEPTEFVRVGGADASADGEDFDDRKTTKHTAVTSADMADAKTEAIQVSGAQPGDDVADEPTELVRVGESGTSEADADADVSDAPTEFVRVGDGDLDEDSEVETADRAESQDEPLVVGSSEFSDVATEYVAVDDGALEDATPTTKQPSVEAEPHRGAGASQSFERGQVPDATHGASASQSMEGTADSDEEPSAAEIDAQMRRLGMARSTPETSSYPVIDDPRSGFYSLPPDAAVAPSKIRTPRENLFRASIAASITGLVAGPIVAYLAADRWMDLPMVMLAMLLATVLPGAILGVAMVWPPDRKPSSTTILLGLTPGLVVSVIFTALAATWALSDVRVAALGFASKRTTVMDRVLRDDSTKVAAAGCRTLLPRIDVPRWRRTILSGMTLRPEVAALCLEAAEEDVAMRLGHGIAGRWHSELMADAEEPDVERLCTLAGEMTRLPISTGEQDARLLRCTLGAPTEAAQRCCSSALTDALGGNERERLDRIRATIASTPGPETARGLLAMAFQKQRNTPGQKEFAEATSFQGEEARAVAVEVACSQIEEDPSVAKYLAASLEDECPVDVAAIPDGREVWDEICTRTIDAMQTQAPLPALCQQSRATLVDIASHAASGMVVYSIRANRRKGILKDVEDILPAVSRKGLTDPDSFLKSTWVGEVSRLPYR